MGDTPRASALLTGVFGARSIPGAVLSSVGFSRQGSKQLHKGIREIPAGKLCQPFPKCCGWAVALLLLRRHRTEQCQHRGCPRSSAMQGSVQPHTAPYSPMQCHAVPYSPMQPQLRGHTTAAPATTNSSAPRSALPPPLKQEQKGQKGAVMGLQEDLHLPVLSARTGIIPASFAGKLQLLPPAFICAKLLWLSSNYFNY